MKNKIFTISIFLFTLLSVFAFFNFVKQTQISHSESQRFDLSDPNSSNPADEPDPSKIQNPLKTNEQTRAEADIPLSSSSGIIIDKETQAVLYAKNIDEPRPIASLTKLATALIFLKNNPGFDQKTSIQPEEYTIGGTLDMYAGEEITIVNLFGASLVGSANNATNTLARNSQIPLTGFVEQMNLLANELNLENTFFWEVTGLEPRNQSTARDYVLLASKAFSEEEIKKISALPYYDFTFLNSQRFHRIKNPNDLLRTRPDLQITASKTGYLDEAGYCLAFEFEKNKKKYVAVILNSPSEEAQYEDVINLITNL
jgi:D-alanyl-D-alanine endopeptidase (penicillin-binding protein 7)